MPDTPEGAERTPFHALALCADLIFASRIRGAATTAGAAASLARGTEDLLQRAVAEAPDLILLDLDARADVITLIRRLKSAEATSSIPVIAFVSHVREDAIADARAAGADRVIARSAFVRMLPSLLTYDE